MDYKKCMRFSETEPPPLLLSHLCLRYRQLQARKRGGKGAVIPSSVTQWIIVGRTYFV